MRVHKIDSSRLLPGLCHFNPSICLWMGKRMMAYRLEDRNAHSWSQIVICELDEEWQPISETNRIIPIPNPVSGTNLFEDPRLYVFGEELAMTFIAATFDEAQHVAAQGICTLSPDLELRKETIHYLDIGNNRNYASTGNKSRLKGEKNWTLLPMDWIDGIIYTLNPLRIEPPITSRTTKAETNWNHGFMSGSTPLISWDNGMYLGCFHSFTYNGKHRQYHAGWYVIDFNRNRIFSNSRIPILTGEIDEDDRRPPGSKWTPRAVFPCGLIDLGDEVAMSYGWLDSTCRIGFFSKDEISASLVPVKKWLEMREVIANPWGGIPGGFSCTVKDKYLRAKTWPSLTREAHHHGVDLRDVHEVLCARVPKEYKKIDWVEA